jgi:hypothetical protein
MKRMSTGSGGDGYEMVGGQITPRGAVWPGGRPVHDGNARMRYSVSNPWLVNFRVLPFSVTVRTICSEAPFGSDASISRVTVTSAPTCPARCAITSSAMRLALRAQIERDRRRVPSAAPP